MSTAEKPKVLIVGDFTFSRGEANSNYVIGLGKAIAAAGFSVEYLAGDESAVREDFREFICHRAPNRLSQRGWRAAFKNLSASENHLLKWLEQMAAGEFHTVVAYPGCGSTVAFLLKLHRLCLAKSWRMLVVVAEWPKLLKSSSPKLLENLLAAIDAEIQIRIINKRIKRVIAVSSFLERYYRNAGCDVIRIPPLIDAQAEKWICRPITEIPRSDLKLLFSGSWSRDRLDLIIRAVEYLRREGSRIVLEFLGSGPDELGKNRGLQKQMFQAVHGALRFHGRVPVERVLPITASADFCVLLRDRAKWSDACFPSKVAEFQALGVPILCNLTSDLGDALRDGENALIVPHVSVAALVTTLKQALALTPSERDRLRQGSLQCAAKHFDYRNQVGRLGEFIGRN